LSTSVTKTPGVVRLNPKRRSSRNVRNALNGKPRRESSAKTARRCTVPAHGSGRAREAAQRPQRAIPPPSVIHSRTPASKYVSARPNRSFAAL
jgi:hypothetical protein